MTTKDLSIITEVLILILGIPSILTINSRTSQAEASSRLVKAGTKSQKESAPKANNTKTSNKLRSGSFISAEHITNGKASIVQENGIYFIELDRTFKTSENGPDLYVILHRSPNILNISKPPDFAIADGDYALIAPLKSFNGKQRYAIPQNIQPEDYQSVAIWCRRFNATFGFAPLSEA